MIQLTILDGSMNY